MMTELSLNILDVAENGIRAGAKYIALEVDVDTKANEIRIIICDDGCGMSEEQTKSVTNPFYTTRTTRKVGLGVPFFKQAAESAGGTFDITSDEGVGTSVFATFKYDHVDRMPLGDIFATVHSLLLTHDGIDFFFKYSVDGREFALDTEEMSKILGDDVSLMEPEVLAFIADYFKTNKSEVDGGLYI